MHGYQKKNVFSYHYTQDAVHPLQTGSRIVGTSVCVSPDVRAGIYGSVPVCSSSSPGFAECLKVKYTTF